MVVVGRSKGQKRSRGRDKKWKGRSRSRRICEMISRKLTLSRAGGKLEETKRKNGKRGINENGQTCLARHCRKRASTFSLAFSTPLQKDIEKKGKGAKNARDRWSHFGTFAYILLPPPPPPPPPPAERERVSDRAEEEGKKSEEKSITQCGLW